MEKAFVFTLPLWLLSDLHRPSLRDLAAFLADEFPSFLSLCSHTCVLGGLLETLTYHTAMDRDCRGSEQCVSRIQLIAKTVLERTPGSTGKQALVVSSACIVYVVEVLPASAIDV